MRALLCIEVEKGPRLLAKHFLRMASGFTMTGSPAGIRRAAVIYCDAEGPQLGKILAVQTDGKAARLLHAIKYLTSIQVVSPMASLDVWAIVEKEYKEVTKAWHVSWWHDVVKKIYPSVLERALEPVLEMTPVRVSVKNELEAFYAGSTLAAICCGIHRLGFALRQVVAQALASELLRPRGQGLDLDVVLELLVALAADAYVWYPLMCVRKTAGTLGGELYSSVVGFGAVGLLADLFKRGCVESTDIPERTGKLACHLTVSLKRLTKKQEGRYLSNKVKALCNTMLDSLLTIYPDKPSNEPLVGLIDLVLERLREHRDFTEGAEIGLLVAATEQFGPGLLNFVASTLEDTGLNVAEQLVFYTPATLMNVLITREYLETAGRETAKVRFLPVGATNPEFTYRIALSVVNELLKRHQELMVLAMGHMSVVASLAKACARCDKPERIHLIVV